MNESTDVKFSSPENADNSKGFSFLLLLVDLSKKKTFYILTMLMNRECTFQPFQPPKKHVQHVRAFSRVGRTFSNKLQVEI